MPSSLEQGSRRRAGLLDLEIRSRRRENQFWRSMEGVPVSMATMEVIQIAQHTSKEICSLPNRISNSCRPSLFFWGHLLSSSLMDCESVRSSRWSTGNTLHDLARLDDALDFINQEGADTHCSSDQPRPCDWGKRATYSLSE